MSSDKARQNAESLLFAMYRIHPRQFSVYPSPEGDIVLEASSAAGDSLIIVCYSGRPATLLGVLWTKQS